MAKRSIKHSKKYSKKHSKKVSKKHSKKHAKKHLKKHSRRFGEAAQYGPGYERTPAPGQYPTVGAAYYGNMEPFINGPNWWYPIGPDNQYQSPGLFKVTIPTQMKQ